jgi:hypothetical protein
VIKTFEEKIERDVMSSSTMRSLAVIGSGIGVGAAMWSLCRSFGIELDLKDSASMDSVGIVDVIVATAIAGFAAWGVYSLMVRNGLRRYWGLVGSAALSISLIGPAWLAEGWSVVPLSAMHFVVAWMLITGFGWAAWWECDSSCAWHLPFRRQQYSARHDMP